MSELKETGTITFIGEPQNIGDKYRKLVFAITNGTGYAGAEKLFAFEIFEKSDADKIANFQKFNRVGQVVDVSYEIRCNENAGRFFTSLNAWKVFANKNSGVDTPIEEEPLTEEPPF
jgi:hypothetical protein